MPRVKAKVDLTPDVKRVEEGLDSIIHRQPCKHDFNSLYSSTDKIINNDNQAKLFDLLNNKINEEIAKWEKQLKEVTSNSLLSLFSTLYDNFKIYSDIIPKIYSSYDSKSSPENKSRMIIRRIYFKLVISDRSIISSVTKALLKQIDYFRDTPTDTNYSIPKNIVDSFYQFNPDCDENNKILATFKIDFTGGVYAYFNQFFEKRNECDIAKYTSDSFTHLTLEENIISTIFRKVEADLMFKESVCALFDYGDFFDIDKSINVAPLLEKDETDLLDRLNKLTRLYMNGRVEPDINRVEPLIDLLCNYIKNRMLSFRPQFEDGPAKSENKEEGAKEGGDEEKAAPAKKTVAKKTVAKKIIKKKVVAKKEDNEEKEDDEEKENEEKPTTAEPKMRIVKKATPKAGTASAAEKSSKSKIGKDEKITAMKDLIFTALKLYSNFNKIFQDSSDKKKMSNAVEQAWNAKEFRPHYNLVQFIHYSVVNNLENIPDEYKSKFPQICKLFFDFTTDKAVFVPLFMNYQIQRIIKNRESEQDTRALEFEIVKQLKSIGASSNTEDFGKHLEEIYNQVRISIDTTKNFKATIPSDSQVDFIATVLNHNIVEKFATDNAFKIMPFLQDLHNRFVGFYQQNHQNSDLKIIPDISQLQFTFRVPKNKKSANLKVYTINTDAWGGSILMAIYEAKETGLKKADINAITAVKEDLVDAYLKMMYHMKLIAMKDKGASNKMEDIEWVLNKNFFNQQKNITIPTVDVQKDKASDVAAERKQQLITIHIIRVGKGNKDGISKTMLIEEVARACRKYFEPSIEEITTKMDKMAVPGPENYLEIKSDGTVLYKR
ncbi:hypothetical protein TVAG_455110 [Trichomonas vaginalis G3]|uniref:Cullin family profile domain-containing protein n=1 Tax=Trichomonas vaginalis (strain ATCC PRA-98 / G3) TaxID=412133 RepID=A2FMX3_TRIV3|nr:Cullin family [Trichomonas vaginalis G3]EAX93741.1 hypothetical protein TVAG_455110 [Trichomonas vaginalis G3]KAI5533756.1 Cullin family [Trichomonas vaginalis G3]|eukprot:XP_001306671.1 hypothetical protein [Trichomonas vaginalis G3]